MLAGNAMGAKPPPNTVGLAAGVEGAAKREYEWSLGMWPEVSDKDYDPATIPCTSNLARGLASTNAPPAGGVAGVGIDSLCR